MQADTANYENILSYAIISSIFVSIARITDILPCFTIVEILYSVRTWGSSHVHIILSVYHNSTIKVDAKLVLNLSPILGHMITFPYTVH
jgi:hypothetical protein